jgi:hypothetical protein
MEPFTYHWESPAVRAGLLRQGQPLRVRLQIGRLSDFPDYAPGSTYPPRVASYILRHLRDAGAVAPDHRNAVEVTLAGWHATTGYRTGRLGYFDGDKLGGLLWGLFWYHRKLERQALRTARREHHRASKAALTGQFFGYEHRGTTTTRSGAHHPGEAEAA